MVLLVNMHLIKGTQIIFHVILLGTGQLRWSISTNGTIGTIRKAHHSNGSIGEYASHKGDLDLIFYVIQPGTGQFQWSIGTNGTIGTNRKACLSNGSVGEYASP